MEQPTKINQLVENLFRHESGKLVAVLTKVLGAENIDLAEDVVQDAILEAISQWAYRGVPENPMGWLYNVAKYKAINYVNKNTIKRKYSTEAARLLQSERTAEPALHHFFSDKEIADDQLRMMFTCCHPSISPDSQIALTLKTLCGFSIPEIARAFLTTEETINKRLVRARQVLRESNIRFEVPLGNELNKRIEAVLETVYLIFNEGYNSSYGFEIIKFELCEEAIRLAQLIASHAMITDKHPVYALLSLMLLNASRFKSRIDENGKIVDLARQDRTQWNKDFIRKGIEYLSKSVETHAVSKYQILATISAHHCTAYSDETTNWPGILELYNHLAKIDSSPIILLNKAVATSKVIGLKQATEDLLNLSSDTLLSKYPYYYSTLGELYLLQKDNRKAFVHFKKAISLSANQKETDYLNDKLKLCQP